MDQSSLKTSLQRQASDKALEKALDQKSRYYGLYWLQDLSADERKRIEDNMDIGDLKNKIKQNILDTEEERSKIMNDNIKNFRTVNKGKKMKKTRKKTIEEETKKIHYSKKKGGGRRRTRRKQKRRRKKRRGGMWKPIQPGLMQNWTGILDHNDVLKANLINSEYLSKEMKPMAEILANRLMYNSINLASFQNRINELDVARREGKKMLTRDGSIKREIESLTDIIKGIEKENKKIRKKIEDLSKESTKKVVNPGTTYRRFEGGKKRKTRKKRRKSRRKRRKSRR